MGRESGEARVLLDIGFVHLHVHSSYSLLEGAMTVATLAKMAAADGQPALALTDTDNLFGGLEFSEKLAGSGLQPIAGVQLSIDFADESEGGRRPVQQQRLPHIVLLAMDEAGYVQPGKAELRKYRGVNSIYHNNGIQTWHVRKNGEVENVEVS